MDLQLRPWTPEEQPAVRRAIARGFLADRSDDPTPLGMLEPDRTLSFWDEGRPVATAAAFSLQMALPGAVRPVAGVTLVTVQPTHRRRGLLTAMMRRQLGKLEQSGEAVAALWASEPVIYGRFGYGLASRSLAVQLQRGDTLRGDAAVVDLPVGEPELGDVREELTRIWASSYTGRPGEYARDSAWWDHVLFDPPSRREEETALRCAVVAGRGYVLFSTRGRWDERGPAGELRVRELASVDGAARLRLWQHLLGVDLVTTWRASPLALDDPLLAAVTDVGRLQARLQHNLFVRLVRVDDALTQRGYSEPVDVVLDVHDEQLTRNARRWRLTADRSGAQCTQTTDPADLALGVEELGSAYLGGTSLLQLAGAGRVRELQPGSLAVASRALRGDVEPLCSHVF